MRTIEMARWVNGLVIGAAFLGCSPTTQTSSSSSWIGCNADVDCNSVPGAVACQAGWCVDSAGQRVASQPEVLVTKLDLLFMIDDSSSMADKQAVLRNTVPDLLNRFVNPVCVDSSGHSSGLAPADPDAPCPNELVREFVPIRDIHIGIVTSSLGGHGVACPVQVGDYPDDRGHLVGSLARYSSPGAPDVDPLGFLDWNPSIHAGQTSAGFSADFADMVTATTEKGCGLEAQLESVYHFLADPDPYAQVTLTTCPGGVGQCSMPSGTDQTILEQRKQFLRPDSALAVILLTDENDCSIVDDGQGFFAVQDANGSMFKGSAACDTNPNDPCCVPCSDGAIEGVLPAGCDPNACVGRTQDAIQDKKSLRCFEMKQRFGVDLLYPTKRYVNALLLPELCTSKHDLDPTGGCPDTDGNGSPDLAANPIYSDLSGSGAPTRPRDRVFLTGIVGVPWQDIDDEAMSNATDLAYLKPAEIPWDVILGEPGEGTTNPPVVPTDPHMIESRLPRSAIPGPGGAYLADPIVGHESSNTDGPGATGEGRDLQHACIFELATPKPCTAGDPSCDCDPNIVYTDPGNTFDLNPQCQQPDGTYSSTQRFAKAYPGLRELEVLKGMGSNGVVGSICARNLTDNTAPDFGYRPAVASLVRTMKRVLPQ